VIRRPAGLATQILVTALAVAAVALAIVAVGVLRVGSDAFAALMMAAGASADHAHAMFDGSVTVVLAAAAAVAGVVAVVLAVVLARRLARPIERLAMAADGIAAGRAADRVPEVGPAELRALAIAYNTMADRLDEQEAIRRDFIVNASHELRTPLTNLQGYLEALRDGVIEPDPRVFDSLREEVDRLTRLAASLDVLAAGPGTPGSAVVEDVVADVGAIAAAALELAAPLLAKRSIDLQVEIRQGLRARIGPDELAQVLGNLLQNAARYTPDGGRVTVGADADDDVVTIRVGNSGPGIPPEDLARIWDRFYRVEKSRDRERGGAGIGLSIVRQLVEAAGGRVGAISTGGWTEVTVSVPAAP
jgi:two-component system, OmpR family, sensor histidine kinase BaeS